MNFSVKLTDFKESINHWNRRKLALLGKVIVTTTLLMAKMNHLFLSLPNIDNTFIKNLSDIFYKFIWSNKTPKII